MATKKTSKKSIAIPKGWVKAYKIVRLRKPSDMRNHVKVKSGTNTVMTPLFTLTPVYKMGHKNTTPHEYQAMYGFATLQQATQFAARVVDYAKSHPKRFGLFKWIIMPIAYDPEYENNTICKALCIKPGECRKRHVDPMSVRRDMWYHTDNGHADDLLGMMSGDLIGFAPEGTVRFTKFIFLRKL